MSKHTARAVAAMALAVGISLAISSTFRACDDEDEKKATREAQQDILKLVDALEKPNGDARAQAQAIHKKYDELKPVMNIIKPRDKGGIGLGPRGRGDGIELRIMTWANKEPPATADLQRMVADIERAARITQAVADLTALYVPRKNAKEWKKYTQDMREAAEEWARAARSGDPARFKKASRKLDDSCTPCHGVGDE